MSALFSRDARAPTASKTASRFGRSVGFSIAALAALAPVFSYSQNEGAATEFQPFIKAAFGAAKQVDGTIEWSGSELPAGAAYEAYRGKTLRAKVLGTIPLDESRHAFATLSKVTDKDCSECTNVVSVYVIKDDGKGKLEVEARYPALSSAYFDDAKIYTAEPVEGWKGLALESEEGDVNGTSSAVEIFRISPAPAVSLTSGTIPVSRANPKECRTPGAKGEPAANCFDVKGTWRLAVHPGSEDRDLVVDFTGTLAKGEGTGPSREATGSAVYELDDDDTYTLVSGTNLADAILPQ